MTLCSSFVWKQEWMMFDERRTLQYTLFGKVHYTPCNIKVRIWWYIHTSHKYDTPRSSLNTLSISLSSTFPLYFRSYSNLRWFLFLLKPSNQHENRWRITVLSAPEDRGEGRSQRSVMLFELWKTWQSARKRSMILISQKWMCSARSSTTSGSMILLSSSSSVASSFDGKYGSRRQRWQHWQWFGGWPWRCDQRRRRIGGGYGRMKFTSKSVLQ